MIDLLLVHRISSSEICNLLAEVFCCSAEKIRVLEIDEFNSLPEVLDTSELECVCIATSVCGDATLLLQLYRYQMKESDLVAKLADVASIRKMPCFIPHDSFDGWSYLDASGVQRDVQQIDVDEENCFRFQ